MGRTERLSDSRGGGRLLGTIHDFTFSVAHYYTYSDIFLSRAIASSPSPEHMAWDFSGPLFTQLTGKPAIPANNPWGPNDPAVGAGNVTGGPGGIGAGTPAAAERNIAVPLRSKRVQVTGASLSFPVNALTGMFVGSDNPLYYLYTTFRSEVAYFRNVPMRRDPHDGNATVMAQRFLTLPLHNAGVRSGPFYEPEFLPGGHFSSEGTCLREDGQGVHGCRSRRMESRDAWAFNIGLDHNQWIRWLNKSNSFVISAQFFFFHVNGMDNTLKPGQPVGLHNGYFISAINRKRAPIGPNRTDPKLLNRPGGPGVRGQDCIDAQGRGGSTPGPNQAIAPCVFKTLQRFPADTELFTLSINTQYFAGNLKPSFTYFYDWGGAYLIQPGIDWTFYDPFRLSIRYNWIEGNFKDLGLFKTKDNVFVELQYLLY